MFECPACGVKLNSAAVITDAMRKSLSTTILRAIEAKIIRLPAGAVLKCFACKAHSTLQPDGKWTIERGE